MSIKIVITPFEKYQNSEISLYLKLFLISQFLIIFKNIFMRKFRNEKYLDLFLISHI